VESENKVTTLQDFPKFSKMSGAAASGSNVAGTRSKAVFVLSVSSRAPSQDSSDRRNDFTYELDSEL
jgi:hypothetical protein